MGIALSAMCAAPILRWGQKALEACDKSLVTDELREVILGIIISTGLVSNFVQVDYTTGLAHAVYNGFTVLPEICLLYTSMDRLFLKTSARLSGADGPPAAASVFLPEGGAGQGARAGSRPARQERGMNGTTAKGQK